MRKLLLILVSLVAISCGNSSKKVNQSTVASTTVASQSEYVEVIYFHTKKRCITCNAIENLTKEVLENNFAEQLKNGKITFKIVNISDKSNEDIANKYEVTWSSLLVNKWTNGSEDINNMTKFGFSYAKNSPDEFKTGLKKKIEELLTKNT